MLFRLVERVKLKMDFRLTEISRAWNFLPRRILSASTTAGRTLKKIVRFVRGAARRARKSDDNGPVDSRCNRRGAILYIGLDT
jgi:hypothetical protein